MNHRELFKIKYPKPVCVGTGLIALDVVVNGNSNAQPKLWAGGSCGNTLTILSYLGWESYPVATLGNDTASTKLFKDLEKWKVNTSLMSRNDFRSTPIIVEKLSNGRSGTPRHNFEWICPNCGAWLPKYKPVLHRDIEQISKAMPKPQVFYFDRVARSSIELAKLNKNHGALIVFEPSGIKDKKLFFECLKVADIVKYSHEKLGHARKLIQAISIPLEIETLGSVGLKYRICRKSNRNRKWKIMSAYTVKDIKDTAGSGDWCSAGIIHLLGNTGRKGFEHTKIKDIEDALRFGQALAALNCYYEGARGSMYSISKQKLKTAIRDICDGTSPLELIEKKGSHQALHLFRHICPKC